MPILLTRYIDGYFDGFHLLVKRPELDPEDRDYTEGAIDGFDDREALERGI